MANYKKYTNYNYVEQNIYSDDELMSYEPYMYFNGVKKTAILYYYDDNDGSRRYSLGILENLNLENITIVEDNLSEVLKYRTAQTRRKYIYNLIDQTL